MLRLNRASHYGFATKLGFKPRFSDNLLALSKQHVRMTGLANAPLDLHRFVPSHTSSFP